GAGKNEKAEPVPRCGAGSRIHPETRDRRLCGAGERALVEGQVRRLLGAVVFALVALALLGGSVLAQDSPPPEPAVADIVSSGPLTRIAVSSELNCQVGHHGDISYEFFDGSSEIGACATILSLNGTQFGPSEIPAGLEGLAPWTPVSQSAVTGNGADG